MNAKSLRVISRALNHCNLLPFLLSLFVICLVGCKKVSQYSAWEAELAPIVSTLTYTQDVDFDAIGMTSLPTAGNEFEVSYAHVGKLLLRIETRIKAPSPKLNEGLKSRYRFFFSRVTDKVVEAARTDKGRPRPYSVTVYITEENKPLDRSKDPFFSQ
jgi:hypothetical protein